MKKILSLVVSITIVLFLIGCKYTSDSDVLMQHEQEKLMQEAHKEVNLPAIINFQEKKIMKQIYELRDKENLICYAYIVDMHGKLHFFGKCVGYGLPYSTQFSNPERELRGSQSITTIPQPEPNGLFMPEGLSATWLLMLDEEGNPRPVYVEPNIIVSPFKLKE